MEIRLYHITDDPKTIGKSMTQIHTYQLPNIGGSDGHNVDKLNPIIRLFDTSATWLNSANYAYIDAFNRFYFATPKIAENGEIEIRMHVDALQSHRTQIKTCDAKLSRSTSGSNYIADPTRQYSAIPTREILTFNDGAPLFDSDNWKNLIITHGGGHVGLINLHVEHSGLEF